MSIYEKLITEVTTCPPADAAEVEELMRDEYPTLNGLSRQRFTQVARDCWAALQYMRTPEGQAYMAELTKQMAPLNLL